MWLELRLFLVALHTLTRCPLPAWVGWKPEWPAYCLRHFPGVGLLVGAGAAAVVWLAGHAWPALVSVLFSMAFTVWLTRARHEVGWALLWDLRDGHAAPPAEGSRALGARGAVALMLLLALKASALHGLVLRDLAGLLSTLVLAQVWSRAALVLALWWRQQEPGRQQARADQAVAPVADTLCLPLALLWCALAAAVAALFVPAQALLWAALALACTGWVWVRQVQARAAGRTAAALDALQQSTELAVYLAVLAFMAQG